MTPQSFLPEEDQGALFAAMRLPEGASSIAPGRGQTGRGRHQSAPGVVGVLSVAGSISSTASRRPTRPFSSSSSSPTTNAPTRRARPRAIVAGLRPKLAAISQAVAFPFNLPPILGLGSTGGFQYVLEALQGQPPVDIAAVARGDAGRRQPAARTRGRVQHLRRRHAADLSRHRSQQGAGARRQRQRYVQRAAIDDRLALHQRLQRFRPHLAGQSAGRRPRFATDRRHLQCLCAQRDRRRWCRYGCWVATQDRAGTARW